MTDQYYEKEARQKLLAGAKKLNDAVKTTMGPRGRNVVIGSREGNPTVTHDGVTVAQAVEVRDEAENIGAQLIKQAANKLNDTAGDGTTTVTVLTYQLMKAGHELLEKDNSVNPMILGREIEEASKSVLQYLESKKLPADSKEALEKIATISAADENIGRVVAEVVHKVGPTGTVTVEPDAKPIISSEMVDGVVVERGYATPQMINDFTKMQSTYEDTAVIVVEHPIHSFLEILPLLEKANQARFTQAVVVAEDFEGDTLPTFVLNNRSGTFRTLAVMAPSFNEHKRQLLDDLAAATGATVIAPDTFTLKEAPIEAVGKAKRVISSRDKTVFIGCEGDVPKRIKEINAQLEAVDEDFEREKLEQREALLSGKVAVIHVGGQTQSEIDEKKFRVDDAVAAAKAAMLEGILPGGGVTLYNAPVEGETKGADLLRNVLKQPFKQLLENSGLDPEAAATVLEDGMGVNVKTGETVDLLKAGIVDPYAVTKQALSTAVSLGIVGLTAGALIVSDEKDEDDE